MFFVNKLESLAIKPNEHKTFILTFIADKPSKGDIDILGNPIDSMIVHDYTKTHFQADFVDGSCVWGVVNQIPANRETQELDQKPLAEKITPTKEAQSPSPATEMNKTVDKPIK